MTEAEWLEATDLYKMLYGLKGKGSDRKIRLFASACCRRVWSRLLDQRSRQAIEVAERYADGEASEATREEARQNAKAAMLEGARGADGDAAWASRGELVALTVTEQISLNWLLGLFNVGPQNRNPTGDAAETTAQSQLLWDIFGNPFQPVTLNPSWLTSTVTALAQQMYDSRDFAAMPILADTLQDVGCENEDILNHCRQPVEHVRGCWVVDLVLGKA